MNPKYQEQYDDGKASENRFKSIIESYGKSVVEATRKQNIEDHIDFFIGDSDNYVSVDVKGPKGKDRTDPNKKVKPLSETWTWVEFKNVNGDPGWLYGKANYIAFEVEEGFLIVKRTDLISFCQEHVDMKTIVENAWEGKYRLYTRKKFKRSDEISYIELYKINGAILLHDKDKS